MTARLRFAVSNHVSVDQSFPALSHTCHYIVRNGHTSKLRWLAGLCMQLLYQRATAGYAFKSSNTAYKYFSSWLREIDYQTSCLLFSSYRDCISIVFMQTVNPRPYRYISDCVEIWTRERCERIRIFMRTDIYKAYLR